MKNTVLFLTLFSVLFLFNQQSATASDYNKKILGKWKVEKIIRKGSLIDEKDPMAPFKKTTLEFKEKNKVILTPGGMQGDWKIEGNKISFPGSKYSLEMSFTDDNNLIVHYVKDNVKVYLKKI